MASKLEGDQRTGVEIVKRASAPLKQIAINAGANGDVVVEQVQRTGQGFNASPAPTRTCFRPASLMPPRWSDRAFRMRCRSPRC